MKSSKITGQQSHLRALLLAAVILLLLWPMAGTGLTQQPSAKGATQQLAFGQTEVGFISTPAEVDSFTFEANAGDVVLIGASRSSGELWPRIRLYQPGGLLLQDEDDPTHAEVSQALPIDGTYIVHVSDGLDGTLTGGYGLYLQRLNAPGNATLLSFGQTTIGFISQVAEMDTFTFTAQEGDVILVGISKASGDLWPQIRLYDPRGNLVGTDGDPNHAEITLIVSQRWLTYVPLVLRNGGSTSVTTAPTLKPVRGILVRASLPGTYTILAADDLNGTLTGSYGLHVQRLNNPGNATSIGFGQTLPSNINQAAEMDAYTFVANAGDAVLVGASKASGDLWPLVRVFDPLGNLVGTASDSSHAEVQALLSSPGTYTVIISDYLNGSLTGGYGLHVQRLNNPGNATSIDFGQTLPGNINQAAEMDAYTFAANAGDAVLVGASKASGDLWPLVRVFDPLGNLVGTASDSSHAEVQAILSSPGTYTVIVSDYLNGSLTGSYGLHVQRLNNPGNATPIGFGQTLPGNINQAAEMDAYTFVANAGDAVLAGASKASGDLWPEIRLFDPEGNLVGGAHDATHSEVLVTLASSGTYTVLLADYLNGSLTGSYGLHLQRLNDPGNTTALSYGDLVAASINMAAEMDAYTFDGSTGDAILISMARTSGSLWPQIRLFDPDGNPVGTAGGAASAELNTTLTETGTYTILAADDLNGTLTGDYNLQLLCVQFTAPHNRPWSVHAALLDQPQGTLLVTSTDDNGAGTLRQALLHAQPGDTITFDPTIFPPGAPVSITLTSPLPTLTQGLLTLDASDAGVILDGSAITTAGASGLTISSDGNIVRGLQIVGFPGNGIELQSDAQHNTIGGDRDTGVGPLGQGNLLSDNGGRGITLVDGGTSFNTIVSNYIGTNLTGTAAWGNGMNGLLMNGASYNDVIDNVISGNDGHGIDLYNADHNTISHNQIGTGADGTTILGNRASGIAIHDGASQNVVGPGNLITNNNGYGIDIHGSTSLGNTITHNSIYSHTFAIGIELWAGGNLEPTTPLITAFDLAAGAVSGVACSQCLVEIFSDNDDEGQIFEGQVLADSTGTFSFHKDSSLAGPHLTATATDADGNTSEFSRPTSGAAGLRVLQQGNSSPLANLQPQHSETLADNRIATAYSLSPPEDFSRHVIEAGVKKVRVAINNLDADKIDWDRPEFYVDPLQDAVVTELANHDIALTYMLSFWDKATYPGGVGVPCPRFKTEEEIQHYLSFVQFIVSHFKDRIEYYEVWNEPDVPICPQWIEGADYLNLVERVVPVIQAEYPEAKIQVGSVSGLSNPDAQAYLFSIVESGVMPLVDVVSWHPFYGESAEHSSAYYYAYPAIVRDIKDTASAHGFTGEYEADEVTYQTPDDPTRPPEHLWAYEEAICAKYYARGIVRHLGADVTVGYGGTGPYRVLSYGTIQSLATTMAGAQPISLPLTIHTAVTDVVSYTFSLPGDAYLVAFWTDGIAVESNPGVTATLRLDGEFSEHKAMAIDPVYGLKQELVANIEDGSLIIHDLIAKDYPRLIRFFVPRSIFLPIVQKDASH